MKRKGTNGRTVVVGDIHGELEGLREVLYQAGLADSMGRWVGGSTVLVQTGDVIDRGRHSKACTDLLRRLQRGAQAAGGAVVRLCGNHELMVLQGDYWFVDPDQDDIGDIEAFRRSLEADVAAGQLLAAWTDGMRLFTHAGLRTQMRDRLLEEIGGKARRPFALHDLYGMDADAFVAIQDVAQSQNGTGAPQPLCSAGSVPPRSPNPLFPAPPP
jgi:hypothetical protein